MHAAIRIIERTRAARRAHRRLVGWLCAAALGAWSGCAGSGVSPGRGGTTRPEGGARATGAAGAFGAVKAEIHPLTRVVEPRTGAAPTDVGPGASGLEAHVELRDAWGLPVRDLGVFRFELYPEGAGEGGAVEPVARPPVRWEIDLTDPERNVKQYDRVTRTYVIELREAPPWAMDATLTLEVALGDRRLTATRRLKR